MLAVAAPPSESGVLFLSRWPGPGVALKVMRVFKCRYIEGQYWLEADMRLQCYTGEWIGYVWAALHVAAIEQGWQVECMTWVL